MASSLVWNLIINDRGAAGANSFRNHLERTRQASDENGFSIARTSDKIAGFATGMVAATGKIGMMAAASGTLIPVVAGVAGAVGAASGALGLMPAAIGAVMVAQAAFKVGTAGVSDALKLAADGGEAYAEALKDLAPAQREFVKAAARQTDGVKKLKQGVGQELFKGLSSEVEPLAKRYLPAVTGALAHVADGYNETARALANWAKQNTTVEKVKDLLGGSAIVARDFTGALLPIAAGLLNIGAASAGVLPTLTEGVGSAADRFESWTKQLTDGGKGGRFAEWVREGVSTLGKFGQVAKGVGGIIASIFSAAGGSSAGTSGLDRLVGTLGKVRAEIDRPAFQTGIRKVFEAIATASAAVSRELPSVLSGLAEMAPAFSNIIAAGGTSFGATLSVIGNMARLAAPAVNSLTETLLPLAPLLGTMVPFLWGFSKALAAWKVIGPIVAAVRLWIVAQGGLNAVLLANPIGLTVAALALLAAGLVLAYKKSGTFRWAVNTAFKAVANTVLILVDKWLQGFQLMFDAMGKLPGKAGAPFRRAGAAVQGMRNKVNALRQDINRLKGKQIEILVKKEYLTTYRSELRRDETMAGRGSGGGIGRGANAVGGPQVAGRAYIVGEHGPEISMPASNRMIIPAGITSAMRAGGGGGGNTYIIHVHGNVLASKRELRALIMEALDSTPAGGGGSSGQAPRSAGPSFGGGGRSGAGGGRGIGGGTGGVGGRGSNVKPWR